MKLFTVIDIPDEDYELSDHWFIDVDGDIRYESEDGDYLIHYKSPEFEYELKPLPKKKSFDDIYSSRRFNADEIIGWNACLDEILGENNG